MPQRLHWHRQQLLLVPFQVLVPFQLLQAEVLQEKLQPKKLGKGNQAVKGKCTRTGVPLMGIHIIPHRPRSNFHQLPGQTFNPQRPTRAFHSKVFTFNFIPKRFYNQSVSFQSVSFQSVPPKCFRIRNFTFNSSQSVSNSQERGLSYKGFGARGRPESSARLRNPSRARLRKLILTTHQRYI